MARHLAGIPVETFHQSTPSNSWIINHNYGDEGKYAVVEVVNVDGEKMLPLRIYHSPDFNQTTITWTSNRAGYARIVGLPRVDDSFANSPYGDWSENGGAQYFSWVSFNGSISETPDIVAPASTGVFSSTFTFDDTNDRIHSDGATPAVYQQSYVFEDKAPFRDRYLWIGGAAEPNGGVIGLRGGIKDTVNNGVQLRAVENAGTYTFVVERIDEGVATVLLTSSNVGAWPGSLTGFTFIDDGVDAAFTFNNVAAGTFPSILPLGHMRAPITVFLEADDDEFIYAFEVKDD